MNDLFLNWWNTADSQRKGQVITGVICAVMLFGYGVSKLRNLSSATPVALSDQATIHRERAVEIRAVPRTTRQPLPRPSISRTLRGTTRFLPAPQPVRTSTFPSMIGIDESQPPKVILTPPAPPPLQAVDVPLRPGDVFHGRAGRKALGYVEFVFLEVDRMTRTVLLTGRLRDYPLWGIFGGTLSSTGTLDLKGIHHSGYSPGRPPASGLMGRGPVRLQLSFTDDGDKLVGQRGDIQVDLTRDPGASAEARSRLLKAPFAELQWTKFSGFTDYQPDLGLATFGSAQARPNLPIDLHIAEVNEELKQILAVLSVKGDRQPLRAFLRGTVLADGISVSFQQVDGVVNMSGDVGEFIRKNRNANVEILLTPDGRIVGHRGPYFFALNQEPGTHKLRQPTRNRRRSR